MTHQRKLQAIAKFCRWNPPPTLIHLDLMHDAEKWLFPNAVSQLCEPDWWAEYRARLKLACIGHPGGAIRASAEQRLDAFLKTVKLWEP